MNLLLVIGAILTLLVGFAHSYLGERYILNPLFRRTNLPKLFGNDSFTKQTLRFAWHLNTIAWVGFATAILLGSDVEPSGQVSAILKAISFTFLVSSVVTVVATRGRHLAWIVFLSISILVWIGS
jgi:hypothetical protein